MNPLLDTHAFVWFAGDDPRLPEPVVEAIVTGDPAFAAFPVDTLWSDR